MSGRKGECGIFWNLNLNLREFLGFDCVGLGLIVLIWVCCDWFLDLGLIWVGLLIGFMGLICLEFGVDCIRIWGRT